MCTKHEKWIGIGLGLCVLLSMLLFFERAHPLVILDSDDWGYLAVSRLAVPAAKFWNPARVFPEILEPYAAGLGALLFSRLGFIESVTAMNGLVLSLFITAYVLAFYRLLQRRLRLPAGPAALLSLLFLLMHFFLFRRELSGNCHLFSANDVTCVYFYVIPGLLNYTLVFLLAGSTLRERFWEKKDLVRKGFLVLAVYLAIFSNLYESIVLASFCGVGLLAGLIGYFRTPRESRSGRQLIERQLFNLTVLLLWFVSLAFESLGGRAGAVRGGSLAGSLQALPTYFGGMSRLFLLFAAGALAALALTALLRKKAAQDTDAFRSLFASLLPTAALTLCFLILLSSRVNSAYILRHDAMFAFSAAMVLLPLLALAELVRRFPRAAILLPLLLVVVYSGTNSSQRTFLDSNDIRASAQLCTALDNAILEQVLDAERSGQTEARVLVPDFGGGNWPLSSTMGPWVAASLYKHGLTETLMEIQIVPDPAMNARFHVLEAPGN